MGISLPPLHLLAEVSICCQLLSKGNQSCHDNPEVPSKLLYSRRAQLCEPQLMNYS